MQKKSARSTDLKAASRLNQSAGSNLSFSLNCFLGEQSAVQDLI
jgi:hypothetical protein